MILGVRYIYAMHHIVFFFDSFLDPKIRAMRTTRHGIATARFHYCFESMIYFYTHIIYICIGWGGSYNYINDLNFSKLSKAKPVLWWTRWLIPQASSFKMRSRRSPQRHRVTTGHMPLLLPTCWQGDPPCLNTKIIEIFLYI